VVPLDNALKSSGSEVEAGLLPSEVAPQRMVGLTPLPLPPPRSYYRELISQVKLLMWKRYTESTKTRTELLKVVAPSILFFAFMILCYEAWPRLFTAGGLEPFLVPFAFWIFVQRLVVQIMHEKANKLQESMRMMGLHDVAYWVSYFLADGVLLGGFMSILCTIMTVGGMFNEGNFGEIFVLLFLFCLSVTAMSFALTAFFDTSQSSGQATLGILLGMFVVYVVIFPAGQRNIPYIAAEIICLFIPPIALQLGCASFLKSYDGVSRGTIYGIMVADIFIYCFLAWYFNQVWPSENGVRKPFWFIVDPNYWFPKDVVMPPSEENADAEADMQVPFEKANEAIVGAPTIDVKQLRKTYGSKSVVNQLSFKMYENQIFALLGHNGAGKSTTISMLTGLIAPDMFSGGNASVYGHSISSEMHKIRKSMGVCPQHDVLFDNLTVREHILFFSQLKGQTYEAAEQEARELTNMFHLDNRMDHLGHELSGGQKRKLSVGIAVCGGSKFVLLDEPTAGMDPLARRELWDLLASLRHGRSMLLVTHYMDEADILGDRVGIMTAGQMQCCGSTQYLKRKFGAGYKLVCDKGVDFSSAQESQVLEFVRKYIPTCEQLFEDGAEGQFICMLPYSEIGMFGQLFTAFESSYEKLNLKNFNIMITTLEDVFLSVGEDHTVTPKNDGTELAGIGAGRNYTPSFFSQVYGMMMRKLKYAMNDFTTLPLIALPMATAITAAVLDSYDVVSKDPEFKDIVSVGLYIAGYLGAAGFIAEFLVRERSSKLRNVLAVMGCDVRAYWIGSFLADFAIMLIPIIVVWITWTAAGMQSFRYGELSDGLSYFNLLLFNVHLIFFSYFFSFTFDTPKSCTSMMPMVIILLLVTPSVIILIIVMIVDAFGSTVAGSLMAGILLWGLVVLTPHGAMFSLSLNVLHNYKSTIDDLPPYGACLAFMIVESALFAYFVYYQDTLAVAPVNPTEDPYFDPSCLETLDEDVLQERMTTLQANDDEYPLIVKELRKVFPPKIQGRRSVIACENLAFRVKKGEIYGLLGANGAGKTTALSMLTRAFLPTGGDALITGNSIQKDFRHASKHLGVVTQVNSLWDRLTVEDHLYLFARVRGVPSDFVHELVEATIDQLELSPHRKKYAMSLSGGMKRKLCVAVALIGDPDVVLLDEPSAGLDPASRRNLWNVILKTMSTRSVILTTHSMEEAEALCGRIGIMVRGQLRAQGTRQHLKYKFGSGYELTAKLLVDPATMDAQMDRLQKFIQGIFPNAVLLADNGGLVTFRIPAEEMSIGKTFSALEANKQELTLEDYSVAQPTLEQVFIRILNAHTPPPGAPEKVYPGDDKVVYETNKCGCTDKTTNIFTSVACILFIALWIIGFAAFGRSNQGAMGAFTVIGLICAIIGIVGCFLRCCACCKPPKGSDD